MKITVIASSNRSQSQSTRIANLIKERYQDADNKVEIDIVDFAVEQIPFWDESIWQGNWHFQDKWDIIAKKLSDSDAFVFVVPEWAGMAPPFLKNFFLLCGTELAHKPSLIVSISSGMGGSYPIAELRMSSFKNTHMLWIPEQVIIRHVESFNFNDNNDGNNSEFTANRLDFCIEVLKQYATRLQGLGNDLESAGAGKHRYGM